MVSKNNIFNHSKKLADNKQRFAIKKFTVGCASVLIGTTIYMSGVSADQVGVDTSSTDNKIETVQVSDGTDESDSESSSDGKENTESSESVVQDSTSVVDENAIQVDNLSEDANVESFDEVKDDSNNSTIEDNVATEFTDNSNNNVSEQSNSVFRKVVENTEQPLVTNDSVSLSDGTTVTADST